MNSKAPAIGQHPRPEKAQARNLKEAHEPERNGKVRRADSGTGPGERPAAATPQRPAAGFVFYSSPTLTLICLPSAPKAAFSLGDAARITGAHPEMLLHYCRLGLITPVRADLGEEVKFDRDTLDEVARIEHYRRHLQVRWRALPHVCALGRETRRLNIEIRFLQPGART